MIGCDELGETENGVMSPGFVSELLRDSAQREPASFFRCLFGIFPFRDSFQKCFVDTS